MMSGKQKISIVDSTVAKKLKIDNVDADNTGVEPPKGKENDSNTLKVYPKRNRTPSAKACVNQNNSPIKSGIIAETGPEKQLPNITSKPESTTEKPTINTNNTMEDIPLIPTTATEILPKKTKPTTVKSKIKDDKKRRCMPKTVDKRLQQMGINPGDVSFCVKAAMCKGYICITGDLSDLEQVIFEGNYDDHEYKVLLKDILYQPDYGDDYEDGSESATAVCKCCDPDDYPQRAYLTRLCQGKTDLDSGKFHNHCTKCKGFGICINDYRMAHCDKCNKHWFAGLMGYPCDNCKRIKQRSKGFPGFFLESDDSDDSTETEGCVLS